MHLTTLATGAATAIALVVGVYFCILCRHRQTAFTSARKYSTAGPLDGVTVSVLPGVGVVFTPFAFSHNCALVYVPGALIEHVAYAPLCHAIARQSRCAVLLIQVPFRLATKMTAARRVSAAIRALPEVRSWFIGGHSLGGVFAASWVAANPGSMQGVVFHASYPAGQAELLSGQSILSYLSVEADRDGLMTRKETADKLESTFSQLPAASLSRVFVLGGNHAGFGHYGPQSFPRLDGERTISLEQQQALVVDATASWLAARTNGSK